MGENHEPPRFSIEVNLTRGERKLAVLRIHKGATLQNAVVATVDLHCKTLYFNKLFGDMNMFSIILSKKDNFLNVYEIHLGGWSSLSSSEEPPLLYIKDSISIPLYQIAMNIVRDLIQCTVLLSSTETSPDCITSQISKLYIVC